MYNNGNIFAKIIRKELPARIIFENDSLLAFHDINPKVKTHVLVVPKGEYVDFADFTQNASAADIAAFFQTVGHIAADILNLRHYKLLTNNGSGSGQEVFHFHVHILSD